MNDVKAADVLLPVHNDTCSSHVPASSYHNDVSGIEFDIIRYLPLFKVELDGIVDSNEGIRITDGSAIVSNDMRNALRADDNLAYFEKLVGCFITSNAVNSEPAFDVIQYTEVLA